MEEYKSKVYVLLDDRNRIMRVDGGYSIQNVDLDTWTFIDEGEGDKYNLCQSHYFDEPILEEHGIPVFKYEDSECVHRTQEEIDADIAAIPEPDPSEMDVIEAQLAYTAMMTDTMIGG